MAAKLNVRDPFPEMAVQSVDGRTVRLPADLPGKFALLLFYRAWW